MEFHYSVQGGLAFTTEMAKTWEHNYDTPDNDLQLKVTGEM